MVILKSKKEIDIMRESGRITYDCHMMIRDHIQEGISTLDLDKLAYDFVTKRGGKPAFLGYKGYPATLTVSINEEVVHGIPSGDRKLKKGDIVGIDLGVFYKDYCSDSAYTWVVGKIPPEVEKLVDVTRESLYHAIEVCVEGNRIGDVSFAVQNHAESNGFSVVRDLVGHGVGRKMHEDPKVPNFGKKGTGHRLKAGMVFAIEPMVNMGSYEVEVLEDDWTVVTRDRKPSAHFEHTIAITKDGPQILTKFD